MGNLYREAGAAEILRGREEGLHFSLSRGLREPPAAGCLARTE